MHQHREHLGAPRRLRGNSLVEVMTSSFIVLFVMLAAIGILIASSYAWAKNLARANSDSQPQIAVQAIARELRGAITVSVDSGGQTIRFQKPSVDDNGAITTPAAADGVIRVITLTGSTITEQIGSVNPVVLARNVITTDPASPNGTSAYQIFTAGSGSIFRSVLVMVATQFDNGRGNLLSARARQTVYLRNVPQQTR